MTAATRIEELNKLSIRNFSALYAALPHDAIPQPGGLYRASFVGPGWLRAIAGPGLVLGGLGGWWGKRFDADGTAVNLVRRDGQLEPRLAMMLVRKRSELDGKPALALIYGQHNPFPWPHIVDELRPLAGRRYLGMTYLKAAAKLALPFVLEQNEPADGV